GWGEMVTTAGYGDLYGSSLVDNYTASFNGTSSASPIVAGAVVAMRGIYKAVTNGNVFPLPMLRDILKATGTPSFDPPNDKIGVMPNLKAAVDTLMIILSTEKQLKKQQFLEVMAYPNPVQDALAVDCYFNRGHISVELFNAMGQLCFRQDIKGHNRKYNTTIDFGGLRSGMYLLRVSDGNHSVVRNIIRE
ncbi:MAG: S8 family peptidase, partial [Flavobacteriales bacterium]